jgi:hypothetical protein
LDSKRHGRAQTDLGTKNPLFKLINCLRVDGLVGVLN